MADVAPFLERHGWVGCAIIGCMGVLFHALNYAPLPIKPLMKQFTGSIRWVGQKLWLWPVVGISVPILFGAGVTAMYSNAYIATAALYAAATVLLAARVVTWQETRSHANRRGIRVLVFLLAIVVLATSFFWDWQTHTGIMTRLSSETNRSRYQVQLLPELPTKDQVEVKVQKSIPKGTSAESPVKPSLAAVPLQPYDISGRRGEVLLALLNTQTESRDTLRVGCIEWIEESCVAAGRFLILFSQAGWSIDSNRVFRFDPDIPQEGMNIEAKAPRYTDKLPPHLGHWNKMDASQVTFFRAFSWMQIPVHSSGNPDMPDGMIGIYFGPSPKGVMSKTDAEAQKELGQVLGVILIVSKRVEDACSSQGDTCNVQMKQFARTVSAFLSYCDCGLNPSWAARWQKVSSESTNPPLRVLEQQRIALSGFIASLTKQPPSVKRN